jgi:hypothetical protein
MNSRTWRLARRLTGAITLVAAALLPAGTYAQSTDTASLIGAISDIQQAAMPGVTITARQVDTGLVRTTVTNDQGRYRLLALPRRLQKSLPSSGLLDRKADGRQTDRGRRSRH